MSDSIRFFLPGPTYVLEEVREQMVRQPIGHRSAAFKELHARIAERLPQVFRTQRDVLLVTSSGSLIWDMAAASTLRGNVLCCVNGAFSKRFRTVCEARGLEVDAIEVPMGEAVDPDLVRDALRRKSYQAVTLAHNETSTGVLSPLQEIVQVVRAESDAMIYVDAVSSLAGARVEVDAWDVDLLFTGAQKALALPPGLAFVTASERVYEAAAQVTGKGYYTDISRWLDKHRGQGTLTTPAVPQLFALDRQLDIILDEGMEARWQRHLALRARTEEWAAANGFTYASSPDTTSPTVSCLKPPAGIDAPALVKALLDRGVVVGGGYGAWKPHSFRIGHMGEVRMIHLEELFGAIEEIVAEKGS
ncbi:MAG: alanine--glyoxylate aminotransferase family protein [Acidobacteriota bacterium]